ncbi:MAG: 23S rRNA (uracil(1939)-C(5))-methyltransferase RlmD [Xanthomonadales bacterium]|nr:23S rRNA (uracil(1939)-C(5))-methyltransferase RlmD [Xanthomonadales bacterium]
MNREFEIEITDLSHDGRGVGRRDGKTVFVAGALAGETVRARQTRRHRSFDEAQVLEVLTPSPDRVDPKCPHYEMCGGCALQHLAEAKQIEAKQHVLLENLSRIGEVKPENVLAPLSDQRWGYRRKARLGVKWVAQKQRAIVGFRERNPRFVADLSRCEVLTPSVGERIEALSELVTSMDARERLPQIEIAAGDDAVALVFRHLEPLSDADIDRLRAFAKDTGLVIYLQPKGIDTVHPLDEPVALRFRIPAADLTLDFLPLDFVQVNAGMNQKMIAQALSLLDPQADDRVLDLFCGLGNFTLPIARRAGQVVGVEGDDGLVARARDNAANNGIGNAEFHAADLTTDLSAEPWMRDRPNKLLLDPPRSGAEAVIHQLDFKGIDRVVYVSCHPGSLGRDAGIMVREKGYRLKAAGAMDMFPHTAHVESIALFERN